MNPAPFRQQPPPLTTGFLVAIGAALTLGVLMAVGGWHLARWVNWETYYKAKLEERVQPLETRMEVLESE